MILSLCILNFTVFKVMSKHKLTFYLQVKYAYFTNGVEVAFVIFDGRDADKNGWFNDDRILYSYWNDIIGYTKVGSSIDGYERMKYLEAKITLK